MRKFVFEMLSLFLYFAIYPFPTDFYPFDKSTSFNYTTIDHSSPWGRSSEEGYRSQFSSHSYFFATILIIIKQYFICLGNRISIDRHLSL